MPRPRGFVKGDPKTLAAARKGAEQTRQTFQRRKANKIKPVREPRGRV